MARYAGTGVLASHFEDTLERLIAHSVDFTRERLPEFQSVPRAELLPGTEAMYEQAMRALRENRRPRRHELTVIARLAAVRAEQGIPIDTYLEAFRLSGGEVLAVGARHAAELELPGTELLELHRHWWEWSEAAMGKARTSFREALHRLSVRPRGDEDDRLALLLTGRLPLPELAGLATTWGLHASSAVHAVRIRVPRSARSDTRQRLLANGAGLVDHDGDLCGFVPLDHRLPDDLTAGISAPVPLHRLDRGYAEASEALVAAVAFERSGLLRIADVALEAAVLRNDDLGAALADRLLLGRDTERQVELEQTVWCWLREGCETAPTARRMYIHANTVRYRLQRFGELTGLDLGDLRTRANLWWALAHRYHGDGTT